MNWKQWIRYFQYHALWPAFFRLCAIKPVDKSKVLFADPYSLDLTDNMKPVYDLLKKDGRCRTETRFARRKTGNKLWDKLAEEVQTLRFLKSYATAGTLVLTETYLPAYCVRRRKNTRVVQLWHGSGALKKAGYAILDYAFGADRKTAARFPMHNCYSLVTVSSPAVIPVYAEVFRCPESIIHPLGIPKSDIFFRPEFVRSGRRAVCDFYEKQQHGPHTKLSDRMEGKKIILYAPTFRGENIAKAHFDTPLDLERLKALFGDRFLFLYKLHPYAKDGFTVPESCRDFAVNISGAPADAALCAADLLISDYSTILFEYSLLERPVIFYAYDLESYMLERSFHYPYRDFVPGPIAENQEELEAALLETERSFQSNTIHAFRETYMSACDGHSSERIAAEIAKQFEH